VSTPGADEPQVAWIALEAGVAVLAADGGHVGTMKEVSGDEEHDIFHGLVVTSPGLEGDRYVPAERVTGIWPSRVQTDLTPDEGKNLEPYKATQMTQWHAHDGEGFGARVKRAWNTLLGRRS
jgi:hypothetical protein